MPNNTTYRRPRFTPSMIVASLALFVALTGTGIAATALAPGSVHTAALANGAVTTPKIANHAVTLNKLAPSARIPGPQGPKGAQGPQGQPGTAGPGAKWALVGAGGTIIAQSGGITIQNPDPGRYFVDFATSLTGHGITVTDADTTGDNGFRGSLITALCGGAGGQSFACGVSNNDQTVRVVTFNATNTAVEAHSFYIVVF